MTTTAVRNISKPEWVGSYDRDEKAGRKYDVFSGFDGDRHITALSTQDQDTAGAEDTLARTVKPHQVRALARTEETAAAIRMEIQATGAKAPDSYLASFTIDAVKIAKEAGFPVDEKAIIVSSREDFFDNPEIAESLKDLGAHAVSNSDLPPEPPVAPELSLVPPIEEVQQAEAQPVMAAAA